MEALFLFRATMLEGALKAALLDLFSGMPKNLPQKVLNQLEVCLEFRTNFVSGAFLNPSQEKY